MQEGRWPCSSKRLRLFFSGILGRDVGRRAVAGVWDLGPDQEVDDDHHQHPQEEAANERPAAGPCGGGAQRPEFHL